MRPQRTITLKDAHDTDDVMEVEVWEGCLIFVTQQTLDGVTETASVLLHKDEVERLRVQVNRYFETLVDDNLLDDEYQTEWYDEQEYEYPAQEKVDLSTHNQEVNKRLARGE